MAASLQSDEAPKLAAALKLDYAAGKARTLSRGRVELGEEWVIELPPGGVYGDVAGKRERVISWVDVDATKVTMRPGATSRQVVITVLDEPIYSRIPALPDPVGATCRGVIPVGYDMYGHLVEIKSPVGDTHMLIAGSSGGGKTEEIKWLVYFALVNGWDIVLVDAKGDGDLAYTEKACLIYEEVPDHERMMEIIAFVEGKHEQRSSENSASVRAGNGKAKHRPLLFIIDEVSTYTDEADSKKEATAFEAKMKTASRKFRSSKILVVLSTQNPKSEVINTSIRSNHRVRLAFGCAETGQSDVILGAEQRGPVMTPPSSPASTVQQFSRSRTRTARCADSLSRTRNSTQPSMPEQRNSTRPSPNTCVSSARRTPVRRSFPPSNSPPGCARWE